MALDDPDRRETCCVLECQRPVEAANLCAAHRYRAKHGLPLSPPVREQLRPFERVIEAFYALERASEVGGVAYHGARVRLRAAVLSWLGPRPFRRRRRRLRPRRRVLRSGEARP